MYVSYGLLDTRGVDFHSQFAGVEPQETNIYPIIVNKNFLTYHKFPQQILITQKQHQLLSLESQGYYKDNTCYDPMAGSLS